MTETQRSAPPQDTDTRRSRRSERLLDVYQTLIWVYGGFLLGILSYSWRVGDDIVFWPWSSAFLALIVGFVVWRRRRAASA
jgi:hypothetical protein